MKPQGSTVTSVRRRVRLLMLRLFSRGSKCTGEELGRREDKWSSVREFDLKVVFLFNFQFLRLRL